MEFHTGERQGLTAKEIVVLKMAAYGLSNDEMAAKAGRTPAAMKYHRTNIIRKLGAANITSAVAIAYEEKILP